MATHSSILAWRIPWTEGLAGHGPWSRRESDTTRTLTVIYYHMLNGVPTGAVTVPRLTTKGPKMGSGSDSWKSLPLPQNRIILLLISL